MVEMTSYLDELALDAARSFGEHVGASITFQHHGASLRVASSDDASARCDQVEARLQDGPCHEAMRTRQAVLLRRIADATRWPQWREQAVHEGYVSSASIPATIAPQVAIALNLFFTDPEPWDDTLLAVARARATAIALAVEERLALIAASHVAAEVRAALDARTTVEHAVGVVMHCNGCSAEEALDVLRRTCADVEVSLETAARIVVGVLSGGPPARQGAVSGG